MSNRYFIAFLLSDKQAYVAHLGFFGLVIFVTNQTRPFWQASAHHDVAAFPVFVCNLDIHRTFLLTQFGPEVKWNRKVRLYPDEETPTKFAPVRCWLRSQRGDTTSAGRCFMREWPGSVC
jgi:hypothetical protein